MLLLDLRSFNVKNTIFFYNLLSSQIMNWATLFSLLHQVNYFLLCINYKLTFKYLRFGVSLGVFLEFAWKISYPRIYCSMLYVKEPQHRHFMMSSSPKGQTLFFQSFTKEWFVGQILKEPQYHHFIYDVFKTQKIDSQKCDCVVFFFL